MHTHTGHKDKTILKPGKMRRISEGEFGIRQPDYLEQLNSQNVKQTIDATAPCAPPPAPWSDPGPVLETRCRADRSFPLAPHAVNRGLPASFGAAHTRLFLLKPFSGQVAVVLSIEPWR